MAAIHARTALLPDGWHDDVRVELEGLEIAQVNIGTAARRGDDCCDALLPGMPNVHSHAFQRGMAGRAEVRGSETDDFWSWRETMYGVALTLSPDDVEAIAAQLYVEMLEAGFTRVGEFHYLHHDIDGRPYTDIAEMGGRICAAAQATGIGLTLLPVFYAHSTFGGAPPTERQRRFVCDLDAFSRLVEGCREHARGLESAIVGIAPHSLRAVAPDELARLTRDFTSERIHIHAAEQIKEVDDCIVWSGARPVDWLIDNAGIDERWCIIHATHMTPDETERLASTGAVAGLCPVTEANLGDGVFNAGAFLNAGGRFGIGSDSNIMIGVGDELRQLEYAQRLTQRSRNVLADGLGSTGRRLFDAAYVGGTQALGASARGIAAGAPADLVSLDLTEPPFLGCHGDAILDAWIFASKAGADGVWVNGRKLVTNGRHKDRDQIAARFDKVMTASTG